MTIQAVKPTETPEPAAPSAPVSVAQAEKARRHLHYVDIVRVLTVALVVAVHVLAFEPIAPTLTAGALLTMTHVSREVFFLLTAYVLSIGYQDRVSVRWLSFWRKRYLFVVVPYVVWTAVYFLADQPALRPFGSALHAIGYDLLTGAARYHLYFLLVSMQIYLVFPLLRGLVRITRRRHGMVLAGCAIFQLLFYTAVQRGWSLGPLTGWLRHPDALLPSYLGFVVAGCVAASHQDALLAWTRAHLGRVLVGCAATLALGVGVFLAQVRWGGQPILLASDVFQPVVVLESVAVTWAFLAAGLIWQDHGRPGRRAARAGADASFGVYLAHPLLLQGLLMVSATTGLTALARHQPSIVVIVVEMVVAVPVLYGLSALLATLARRTPASLPLTGRARRATPHRRITSNRPIGSNSGGTS
ncbi:MAG TPA: acyltransferase [Pseudonocardiaceae bacterium]|nr:acyltransferase [Pseudonocardiaceae bacterium]